MVRNCAPENLDQQPLDSGFALRAPRNDDSWSYAAFFLRMRSISASSQ
jgi:hypothetical protein